MIIAYAAITNSCRKFQCSKYVIKRLIRTHFISRMDIFQEMHMKFYQLCFITGFEDINDKHVGNLISKQPHEKGILILRRTLFCLMSNSLSLLLQPYAI